MMMIRPRRVAAYLNRRLQATRNKPRAAEPGRWTSRAKLEGNADR